MWYMLGLVGSSALAVTLKRAVNPSAVKAFASIACPSRRSCTEHKHASRQFELFPFDHNLVMSGLGRMNGHNLLLIGNRELARSGDTARSRHPTVNRHRPASVSD